MANLFNDAGAVAIDAYEWVVADVCRADFGSVFNVVDEGVVLRDSAIVEIDGEEVSGSFWRTKPLGSPRRRPPKVT